MRTSRHETVLLEEAVTALNLKEDSVVIDATGGAGGHSARILETLGRKGTLIILESDPTMVEKLKERFAPQLHATEPALHVLCKNFRNLRTMLGELGLREVSAILADLGWNSEQFEEGGRGFSFQKEEPLLMTYGDPMTAPFTAYDVVNTWSEATIADALYAYADERFARKIAAEICSTRAVKPIATTYELVACIERAIPKRFQKGRLHPATKSFQALRIAVNDELETLSTFIDTSVEVLTSGGRLAIISFHSIEDRIVKQKFRALDHENEGTVLTKKPVDPSEREVQKNPRARSAHLRIFQKA